MQRVDLLPQNVNYYKANLHCHTVHSDGSLTPEQIKEEYQKRGYQVVAITDHRNYINHSELNDENFISIAAVEVDINQYGGREWDFSRLKTYHINLYDTHPEAFTEEKADLKMPLRRYSDTEYINGYVDEMKELGFIACYNHPYWSLQTYEDYKNLRGFWGMEIYNHGCELDGLYGYHPQSYDEMLRSGQNVFCVSTDDNHNGYGFDEAMCDSFGGYVMIGAKELTYTAIMDALKKGEFYSVMSPDGRTEGPSIHEIYIEGNELHIKCSPVDKIFVQTMGRFCHRAAAKPGETITEAVFTLKGNEGYIRVDARDAEGRHANSNAYFLEEIMKNNMQ